MRTLGRFYCFVQLAFGLTACTAAGPATSPATAPVSKTVANLPAFHTPMDDNVVKLAGGKAVKLSEAGGMDAKLLVPMETDPAARRPGVIAVIEGGKTLRLYEAADLTQRWSSQLPGGESVLLGYTDTRVLIVQASAIIGMDLNTGETAFKILLDVNRNQLRQYQNQQAQLNNVLSQILQKDDDTKIDPARRQQNGDGEFTLWPPNASHAFLFLSDAQSMRDEPYRNLLGGFPAFNAIRLFGNRIVAIVGDHLSFYDAATSKLLWPDVALPAGVATTIVGNEQFIVAGVQKIDEKDPMLPDTGFSTFVVIDAETGKQNGTVALNEHLEWCDLSADGILTCATAEGVSAFDLAAKTDKPIWQRPDARAVSPTAVTVTAAGIMVVSRDFKLLGLSKKNGNNLFEPKETLEASDSTSAIHTVKLIPDRNTVIVQTSQTVRAYSTKDGSRAWGSVFAAPPPPIVASQMTQNHIILLCYGRTSLAEREVKLVVSNRVDPKTGELTYGKNELEKPLRRSAERTDFVGPVIQRWQVVDDAICLDINGSIVVYRCQPAK